MLGPNLTPVLVIEPQRRDYVSHVAVGRARIGQIARLDQFEPRVASQQQIAAQDAVEAGAKTVVGRHDHAPQKLGVGHSRRPPPVSPSAKP